MIKDDVLLTGEEWNLAYIKGNKAHLENPSLARNTAIMDEQKKAQCLKLLDWGEQRCNIPLHNLDGDFSYIRFECPECRAELRKELGNAG